MEKGLNEGGEAKWNDQSFNAIWKGVKPTRKEKINTQTRRGPSSIVIWLNHWPTKPNWEAKWMKASWTQKKGEANNVGVISHQKEHTLHKMFVGLCKVWKQVKAKCSLMDFIDECSQCKNV